MNLFSSSLTIPVSAHAKPIVSMDICNETGMLITTSEDTFVRVWMLKPDNDSYVRAFFRAFSLSHTNDLFSTWFFLTLFLALDQAAILHQHQKLPSGQRHFSR